MTNFRDTFMNSNIEFNIPQPDHPDLIDLDRVELNAPFSIGLNSYPKGTPCRMAMDSDRDIIRVRFPNNNILGNFGTDQLSFPKYALSRKTGSWRQITDEDPIEDHEHEFSQYIVVDGVVGKAVDIENNASLGMMIVYLDVVGTVSYIRVDGPRQISVTPSELCANLRAFSQKVGESYHSTRLERATAFRKKRPFGMTTSQALVLSDKQAGVWEQFTKQLATVMRGVDDAMTKYIPVKKETEVSETEEPFKIFGSDIAFIRPAQDALMVSSLLLGNIKDIDWLFIAEDNTLSDGSCLTLSKGIRVKWDLETLQLNMLDLDNTINPCDLEKLQTAFPTIDVDTSTGEWNVILPYGAGLLRDNDIEDPVSFHQFVWMGGTLNKLVGIGSTGDEYGPIYRSAYGTDWVYTSDADMSPATPEEMVVYLKLRAFGVFKVDDRPHREIVQDLICTRKGLPDMQVAVTTDSPKKPPYSSELSYSPSTPISTTWEPTEENTSYRHSKRTTLDQFISPKEPVDPGLCEGDKCTVLHAVSASGFVSESLNAGDVVTISKPIGSCPQAIYPSGKIYPINVDNLQKCA